MTYKQKNLQGSNRNREYVLFTNSIFRLFAQKTTRFEYIQSVVEILHELTGCRCVGIRVINDENMIPYESYIGFNQKFWEKENCLSIEHDQCACIRVIKRKPEPHDIPVMTPAGSFILNNIREFVGMLTEKEISTYRGECLRSGFQSIGIIPVIYRETVVGSIHLADEKKEMISQEIICYVESIVPIIGEAIHRFNLEDELRKHRDRLEEMVQGRTAELKKTNEQLQREMNQRRQTQEALQKALAESRQREAEMATLFESTQSVLKYRLFKEAAQAIFTSCKHLVGATVGYVALLNEACNENYAIFLDPGEFKCVVDPALPMPVRGLREEAYRLGQTVYHNDFANSEYKKMLPQGHVIIENVLFTPLMLEGKALGLLGLGNKPGGFTERDAKIAAIFGELAAIALNNSRMLQQLQGEIAERRQLEDQLRKHRDHLEEMVQERTAELKKANEQLQREMAERRKAEEALKESEEKYRTIFETTGTATGIVEEDTTISLVNAEYERMSGYKKEEIEGKKSWTETVFPEDLEKLKQDFYLRRDNPSSPPSRNEFRFIDKQGNVKNVIVIANVISGTKKSVASLIDITDLKRTQEELNKTRKQNERYERMAALGTMAAGIAHEINQPLNSIKIIVDGMFYLHEQGKTFSFEEILERLNEVSAQVDRISNIIKNMRFLTKNKSYFSIPSAYVNLNDIVNKALRILEPQLITRGIKLKRSLKNFLPIIKGNGNKLEVVVVNLVLNSMQALETVNKKEKVVFIATRVEENIILEVSDNATGVCVQGMDKIFDPFFTTKEVGVGMGLGLSIVYSIVSACNGTISVKNNSWGGATFRLEFPRANC